MTLEARYVRRKDLPQYLPTEQLKDIKNARKKNDSISSGADSEVLEFEFMFSSANFANIVACF